MAFWSRRRAARSGREQAIIATNSYSDLTEATRSFQHTLIPFRSAIIATEKLSPNLAASIMPTRRTYTETKRMMRWFRMVDDRVIFGGRGAFGKQDSRRPSAPCTRRWSASSRSWPTCASPIAGPGSSP